jgi:hypothetical protein
MQRAFGFDRTATWREVCRALAFLSEGIEECTWVGGVDEERGIDPGGSVSRISEELAWQMLAREAVDHKLN